MTGMPKETIRYTLRKRFPQFDLRVETCFNLGEMGLQRYSGILRFPGRELSHADSILDMLARVGFLTYRSQMLLDVGHVTLFAVPVVAEDDFQSFLRDLVAGGILADAKLKRIDWARNPELMCQYYDFGSGGWGIDWERIESQQEVPPSPIVVEEPRPKPAIDRTDILLIKELEASSLRSLASISEKLAVNPVTLRWHYRKHVLPFISHNRVRWLPVRGDQTRAVGASFDFGQLNRSQLARIRLLFNNFPFTWFEAGSRDGSYRADLAIPVEEFVISLDFLSVRLGKMSLPQWKAYILNPLTRMRYTIPYENFSEEKGWVFDPKDALESILSVARA